MQGAGTRTGHNHASSLGEVSIFSLRTPPTGAGWGGHRRQQRESVFVELISQEGEGTEDEEKSQTGERIIMCKEMMPYLTINKLFKHKIKSHTLIHQFFSRTRSIHTILVISQHYLLYFRSLIIYTSFYNGGSRKVQYIL